MSKTLELTSQISQDYRTKTEDIKYKLHKNVRSEQGNSSIESPLTCMCLVKLTFIVILEGYLFDGEQHGITENICTLPAQKTATQQ